MPIEAKPLFRPDVLRTHLAPFEMPAQVEAFRPKLTHWADLLSSGKANALKEQEILPDFLTDFFCGLLGYTRPADGGPRYTINLATTCTASTPIGGSRFAHNARGLHVF